MRGLMVVSLLMLTACGGGDEAAEQAEAPAVEQATAVAEAIAGTVDTSNLPDYVTMYAGGVPVMNMASRDGEQSGGIFTYTVEAGIGEVAAFHRAAFETAGIAIQTEVSANGSMSFGGESGDRSHGMFVTISGGMDGEPTAVNVSYARKPE